MRSVKQGLLPLVVAAALAGCAPAGGGGLDGLMAPRVSHSDLAYAALARGDLRQAVTQADLALAEDPDDPHALLARGVALRSGAGSEAEAAAIFRRLTESERARDAVVSGGPWSGMATTTVAALAGRQLDAMNMATARPAGLTPPPGTVMAAAAPTAAGEVSSLPARTEPPLSGIELLNAAQRFLVLRRLRDEGMITDGEYGGRRAANIGALLPYSSQTPPAPGLGRPVPTAEQVMARLDALRESLTGGSLRPEEHFAERESILDALLPADPKTRMAPPSPPTSLADAAERADALQRLRDMGAISKDEYGRERAALEKAAGRLMTRADGAGTVLVPKPTGKGSSGKKPAAPAKPAVPAAPPKTDAEALAAAAARGGDPSRMVGRGPVVAEAPAAPAPARPPGSPVVLHLASYKSKEAAEAGWAALRGKFSSVLGALSPRYDEVNLGTGQGTYWRLNAGPLSDSAAAQRLCDRLAAQGQYCRTAFAEG
ncbi:SPOR domain-containing protein [Caenispirillum bisanense]|uniref:Sporulation related domain-containing protein n=1 Tax=Caenispirillum bisanense TaxID=414052 RepID=A0A286GY04_9PROT|nr:SPOR domain-containing protein [Caenispirillum bisanense]SOD99969.1 Sporulation related domain-containing protein [Caenispirillum bisanense]